jgi:hypothetical protein
VIGSPFSEWVDTYRRRGLWPRPVKLGTKACHVKDWQSPDSQLPEAALASWLPDDESLACRASRK